nr:pyrimidine/purine nucleoside phosphorylase [Acinetobacter haemolyticus]
MLYRLRKSQCAFQWSIHQPYAKIQGWQQKDIRRNPPLRTPLVFKTHLSERIEITSGQCKVQIGNMPELKIYSSEESFEIPANSQFSIISDEVVDYVCHLD